MTVGVNPLMVSLHVPQPAVAWGEVGAGVRRSVLTPAEVAALEGRRRRMERRAQKDEQLRVRVAEQETKEKQAKTRKQAMKKQTMKQEAAEQSMKKLKATGQGRAKAKRAVPDPVATTLAHAGDDAQDDLADVESDAAPITDAAPAEDRISERILAFFGRQTARLGHGLTARQTRTLWAERTGGPPPNALSTRIHTLAQTGRLLIVGADGSERVYGSPLAPAQCRTAPPNRREATLRALYLTLMDGASVQFGSRGVPASVVRDALSGVVEPLPTSSEVVRLLRDLAKAKGCTVGQAPFQVREHTITLEGGARRHLWSLMADDDGSGQVAITPARKTKRWRERPVIAIPAVVVGPLLRERRSRVSSEAPAAVVIGEVATPLSLRQAILGSFREAEAALGVPPTRAEWALYVSSRPDGLPPSVCAAAVGERTDYPHVRGALLVNRGRGRRAHVRDVGLDRVPSTLAGAGITDHRYSASPPSAEALEAVHLCERLVEIRPDLEIAERAAMAEWCADERGRRGARGAAGERTERVLQQLDRMRGVVLARTVFGAQTPERWKASMTCVRAYQATLAEWIATQPQAVRARSGPALHAAILPAVLETVDTWAHSAEGVERYRDSACAPACATGPAAGGMPPRAVRWLYDTFGTQPGTSGDGGLSLSMLVRSARRSAIPGTVMARRVGGDVVATRSDYHLDAVDVWEAFLSCVGAVNAWTRVVDASATVGRLIRDPDYLSGLIVQLPAGPSDLRATLLVARGLLGVGPRADDVGRTATTEEARAIVLAAVLAAPQDAKAAMMALVKAWKGRPAYEEIAWRAVERLQCDEPLFVLE